MRRKAPQNQSVLIEKLQSNKINNLDRDIMMLIELSKILVKEII